MTSYVYRQYSANGELLYIGCSSFSFIRIGQHATSSYWFPEVADVKIQAFPSRVRAEDAEKEAIRDENPKYNGNRYPVDQVDRKDFSAPLNCKLPWDEYRRFMAISRSLEMREQDLVEKILLDWMEKHDHITTSVTSESIHSL